MLPFVLLKADSSQVANPLFSGGDPWVVFDADKRLYYYSANYCSTGTICLKSAATLSGLVTAPWVGVWNAPATGPNSTDIWAPELHKINGNWYIYYAADDNGDNTHHRLFVLEADTSDPLKSYSMAKTGAPNGQLVESTANWAIDPDVFTAADGKLYIVWSCSNFPDGAFPQATCLAEMSDPLHITGRTAQISAPTEPWEMRTAPIQEGPVGFTRDGHTYITYSASASWTDNDYCVGLLTASNRHLLDPRSWTKYGPIFDHHGTTYGPGSVVFVPSPNGQETWNFYHAIDNLTCNPSYSCRDIRMQKMSWSADGTPVLGYPLSPGFPVGIPSGEPGGNAGTDAAQWGPAFGDAAKGNKTSGNVVGSWLPAANGSIQNTSLGTGWNQIFSQTDPNLEDYKVSVGVQWVRGGTTSASPKYGVYAAYSDSANYVSVWLDAGNKMLATYGMVNGVVQNWANCAIPSGFDPAVFNQLEIRKAGKIFSVLLNDFHLPGACNDRVFDLLNGQVGLVTEDTLAKYRRLSIAPPNELSRRPRP